MLMSSCSNFALFLINFKKLLSTNLTISYLIQQHIKIHTKIKCFTDN